MKNVKRKPFVIFLIILACACLIVAGIIVGGSRKKHDPSSADGNAGIAIPADNKMEKDNKEAEQPKEESPDDGGNETVEDSPDELEETEQPKEESPDDGGNETAEDSPDELEDPKKNENGDIELPEIH